MRLATLEKKSDLKNPIMFNGTNYTNWSRCIQLFLKKDGLWKYVRKNYIEPIKDVELNRHQYEKLKVEQSIINTLGIKSGKSEKIENTDTKQTTDSNDNSGAIDKIDEVKFKDAKEKFDRYMQRIDLIQDDIDKATAKILLTLEKTYLADMSKYDNPYELWKMIEKKFNSKQTFNLFSMHREFKSCKYDGDFDEFLAELEHYRNQCVGTDFEIGEKEMIYQIISNLPKEWDSFLDSLRAQNGFTNYENLKIRLRDEWAYRELSKKDSDNETENAFSVIKPKHQPKVFKTFKGKCWNCDKVGHMKENCFEKGGGKEGQAPWQKKKNKMKKEINHLEVNEEVLFDVEVDDAGIDFIVDSGASAHICNKVLFFHYIDDSVNTSVQVANGIRVQAKGIGTVKVQYKGNMIVINDVLYCPEIKRNILSVSKLTDNDVDVHFKKGKCTLKKDKYSSLIEGKRNERSVYTVRFNFVNTVEVNMIEDEGRKWHERFGHLNYKDLNRLYRNEIVDGIKLKMPDDVEKRLRESCHICKQAKSSRKPVGKEKEKSKVLLEVIHSDICGPFKNIGRKKEKYFCTFIDECSGYCHVYIMKSKDEVFKYFKDYQTLIENQTGLKIKIFNSDRGSEYVSKEFQRHLRDSGIAFKDHPAYSPELNGIAERMNRTLQEMALSMIINKALPKWLWPDAILTAAYIRNRCPNSNIIEGKKTPFEILNNKRPNVKNMKVFGSIAIVHTPKQKRRKFDDKGAKGLFIGYGKAGYKILLDNNEVIYSKDVDFIETTDSVGDVESESVASSDDESSDGNGLSNNNEMKKNNQLKVDDDIGNSIQESKVTESKSNMIELKPRREAAIKAEQKIQKIYEQSDLRKTINEYVNLIVHNEGEPMTYEEAINCDDAEIWKASIQDELNSLKINETFSEPVDLPTGKKALDLKYVFKYKKDENGNIYKAKTRLVAKGYNQKPGIDYRETFSPVIKMTSLRAGLALAAMNKYLVKQYDVKTAYLYGKIDTEIYVNPPKGMDVQKDKVLKLNKSIYGLKQAGRIWNDTLTKALKDKGFVQVVSDSCVFILRKENTFVILYVYVDDIVTICNDEYIEKEVMSLLKKDFEILDQGKIKHLLGMKVSVNEDGIALSQTAYIESKCKQFGVDEARPVSTPMEVGIKLKKEKILKDLPYKELIGSIQYISSNTRPDITFACSDLSRFMDSYNDQHFKAGKRILKYLNSTKDYEFLYSRESENELEVYVDANHGGDDDDRRSVGGYIIKLAGAPVSWKSKRLPSVTLSSAESEYVALSECAKEIIYLKNFLFELGFNINQPIKINEDNQAAIAISKNPEHHGRTKHIDIKVHFIREKIAEGIIEPVYCSSDNNIADIMTKALAPGKFNLNREKLGIILKEKSRVGSVESNFIFNMNELLHSSGSVRNAYEQQQIQPTDQMTIKDDELRIQNDDIEYKY